MSNSVTNQSFLKALDKLNLGNKLVSWDIIVKILDSLQIIILPEPTTDNCQWKKKKYLLEHKIKRIHKERISQKKTFTDYFVKGILLDPVDYQGFLCVKPDCDSDEDEWEDITDENVENNAK